MEQQEMETKVRGFSDNLKAQIEANPLAACAISMVLGAVFVIFRVIVVPLIFLAVVGGVVYYFFTAQRQAEFSAGNGDSTPVGERPSGSSEQNQGQTAAPSESGPSDSGPGEQNPQG